MIHASRKNVFGVVSVILFVGLSLWWLVLNFTSFIQADDAREAFAASYGLMALVGGMLGLYVCMRWGGFRSLIGRVVGFLSLGLLAQEFGQIAYSYYSIVLGIEVPYPSIGDLGFFGSIPFYILGAYFLVKICVATTKGVNGPIPVNPISLVVPVALLTISYLFLMRGYEPDWENIPGTFLDFAYPFFQAIYVSLALIAFYYTKHMANGIMHKKVVFLLVALVVQYLADFVFLYKAHRDLYVTAGITDFLYLLAYFLMSLAIINLNDVFERLKSGKINSGNGGAVN